MTTQLMSGVKRVEERANAIMQDSYISMNDNIIDLFAAGEQYKRRVGIIRFGWPIVRICKASIKPHLEEKEKQIIEDIIKRNIYEVSWWSRGLIPLPRKVSPPFITKESVDLMAESIIFTCQAYHSCLFGDISAYLKVSNQNQFCQGIEWMWDGIADGYPIFDEYEEIPFLKNRNK